VSEANPRVEEKQRYAPRQASQELPALLPGRIRLLQYSEGSLRSPRLTSRRPPRACLQNTLPYFMKSCT